ACHDFFRSWLRSLAGEFTIGAGERAWNCAPEQVGRCCDKSVCRKFIGEIAQILVDAVNGTCKDHCRNRPAGPSHRPIATEIVARAPVDLDGFARHAVPPGLGYFEVRPAPHLEAPWRRTLGGEGGCAEVGCLLLLLRRLVARIISRIDIIDRERAHAMNLDHGRGRGPAVVLHALLGSEETARSDRFAFPGIELVTHRDVGGTDEAGDILPCWMA